MYWLEIFIVLVLVSLVTSCTGSFLVLQRSSLVGDALSHAVLLGIVLLFFVVHDLYSPLLLVGAALAGVVMLFLVDRLVQTRLLSYDAALGVIFPSFFSLGVLLITLYARDVHLDIDMVMLGELLFVPFNRLSIAGVDCGPLAMWFLGVLALALILFVILFYRALVAMTFDETFAALWPSYSQWYGVLFTFLVSLSAVALFDIVGSLVVVALTVVPAATALFISSTVMELLLYSFFFSLVGSWSGYLFASHFDVSVAGSLALMQGMIFLLFLLFSREGYIARLWQRIHYGTATSIALVQHLLEDGSSLSVDSIAQKMAWSSLYTWWVLKNGSRQLHFTVSSRGLVRR